MIKQSVLFQAEKISKVIKASGNSVEGYWPSLFAKALQGQDINNFLTAVSSGASAPAAASAAAATNNDAAAEEGKTISDTNFF